MGALWNGLLEGLAAVMAWLYALIPNFGITIVLLTILLNILLFPLTLKQTRSTKAMQEIQPEIKKLQKKHKDDQQKLNEEMMELYRSRGVNPIGCLFPILIQMPIWFALFRVLQVEVTEAGEQVPRLLELLSPSTSLFQAIEVGLPNFLGMNLFTSMSAELANGIGAVIPYAILILLVMVTQYVQQLFLTPPRPPSADGAPGAAQMQGIMRIMPLFFGFISYGLPAGLVVYFATSNFFRIGQQEFLKWLDRPRAEATGASEPADNPGDGSADEGPQTKSRPQGSAKKRRRRRR